MSKDYDFDDFDELLDEIEEDLTDIMSNQIKEETEETLHEYSRKIGDMYPEKTWENRYDRNPNDENAFENKANIISEINNNNGEIVLKTYNIARGEIYDRDKTLDDIIETGIGYQFGHPPERPVVAMTQEEIDEKIEDEISKGLNNKGWNIK